MIVYDKIALDSSFRKEAWGPIRNIEGFEPIDAYELIVIKAPVVVSNY